MHIVWQLNQGGRWFAYEKTRAPRELLMATAVPFIFHGIWDSGIDPGSCFISLESSDAAQIAGWVLALAMVAFGIIDSIRTIMKACRIAKEDPVC